MARNNKIADDGMVQDLTKRVRSTTDHVVSVKFYGAKGDGATLDSAAINACIAANPGATILIPAGTYMIDPTIPVNLNQPGTTIRMSAKAVLKMQTTDLANYSIVVVNADDCAIVGGTVMGDVSTHTGSTGEWGHGINVQPGSTANRLLIDGVTAKNCWGDGFYIGGASADITLRNCRADTNRRNGLSITGGSRILVQGGHYLNTGAIVGTAPMAGIDVEPNPSSGNDAIEILIIGVQASSNFGAGIECVRASGQTSRLRVCDSIMAANHTAGFLSAGTAGSMSVELENNLYEYNSTYGIHTTAPGVNIQGGKTFGNTLSGAWFASTVNIQGLLSSYNSQHGVAFAPGADGSLMSNCIVRDNCTGAATSYYEILVSAPSVAVIGTYAKPATSGNRALYGFAVTGGGSTCTISFCRSGSGTSGQAAVLGDTVQTPLLSSV